MQLKSAVFVVDDDEAVRESIVLLLEAEELNVEAFVNAEAFLDAYHGDWAGCLVLDISMPGMTGLELQETLQARQIRLPIIFITGHGDVPMSVRALKAGAFDFIEKPFNHVLLLSRIKDAIAWDIQIREQETRKVAQAVQTYAQSIVETVREPLLVLDENLQLLSANRSFYKTFKIHFPEQEIPVLDVFAKQSLWRIPRLREQIEAIASSDIELLDLEIEYNFPNVGQKILQLNARKLRQSSDLPLRILLAIEDVTERKHFENELKQHRDHLEELVTVRTADLEVSNKELESYSYSIAHDLRAPLRSMTSFSQILMEDVKDQLTPDDLANLNRIVVAGKKMSQLIDDILELSRITRTELHFGTVNLSKIGNEVIARLKQLQPSKKVQCDIQENLVVKGDSRLLEVALQNLMENAWKYTRNTTSAQIEFGVQKHNGETVYYVKDNGVGFDMQYKNRLFKPFHRLHSPQEFEGTGIGLATVQRIIQRHSGRIWVKAELNRGATFFFMLPESN